MMQDPLQICSSQKDERREKMPEDLSEIECSYNRTVLPPPGQKTSIIKHALELILEKTPLRD